MSKKPKIFKPNMSFIDNNEKAYVSFLKDDTVPISMDENDSDDVISFLEKLSSSGTYIFNKKVKIVTSDDTYHTRIAGKIGNRLITLDNDSINIDDILKIEEE